MSLNLKLQMRLSQQLIMTPQLQQAIKLLQLSRQELEELVQQSLVENPVLEEGSDEADGDEAPAPEKVETDPSDDFIQEASHPENDLEWQNYVASGSGVIPERGSRGGDGDEMGLEATLSRADTLHQHLSWQLEMASLCPLEMTLGEHLIGNLDDDGYLTVSIQELLELNPDLHRQIEIALRKNSLCLPQPEDIEPAVFGLKHLSRQPVAPPSRKKKALPAFAEEESSPAPAPVLRQIKVHPKAAASAEAVLRFLQTFDPVGVGARSLRECLEIQLRAMGLAEALPFAIVRNDLKLLENKDLRKIARRHKVDVEEVVESYKLIISLEPKPGRPFGGERSQHIIPDVYIFKFSDEAGKGEDRVGQYRIVLNDSGLPRLRISSYYRNLADRNGAGSELTHEYIMEKIKAGNWLMKSIEQRQKTIFRVTKSILKHQYEFFERGINYLKPMVLKDVAEDISVHESTVSRITTNKFVHTPQGIFELKYFFTSGIDQGQGEVISSKKIKDMIHKIITSEDAREPFTDIQIAERLSRTNHIKVARRTVAKYREALNLLPSNKRKQLF